METDRIASGMRRCAHSWICFARIWILPLYIYGQRNNPYCLHRRPDSDIRLPVSDAPKRIHKSKYLLIMCHFYRPLLELANYHVLGRVLYYVPHFAPLPPNRVLSTFGLVMMIVETLNALGVSLSSNTSSSQSQQDLGSNLTLASLALQFALIFTFLILAAIFHRRCAKANICPKYSRSITTQLIVLYVSMTLILVRCVYRLVEHLGITALDLDSIEKARALSPILRYEYYFYIFEASLMLINSVIWNIWNPGRFLPRSYKIHLAKDGSTEVVEEEDMDRRPLIAKVGHVLTAGVFFGKKKGNQHSRELDDYEAVPS